MSKIIFTALFGLFMLFSNSAFAYDYSPMNFSSPLNMVSTDPIQTTINPLNIYYQERHRETYHSTTAEPCDKVTAGVVMLIALLAIVFVYTIGLLIS